MNVGKNIDKLLILNVVISFFYFSFTAKAYLPDHSFACQIQHFEKGIELKLVQAKSIDEAIEVAQRDKHGKEKISEVIQCVEVGKEKFRDRNFQKDFENTPR